MMYIASSHEANQSIVDTIRSLTYIILFDFVHEKCCNDVKEDHIINYN